MHLIAVQATANLTIFSSCSCWLSCCYHVDFYIYIFIDISFSLSTCSKQTNNDVRNYYVNSSLVLFRDYNFHFHFFATDTSTILLTNLPAFKRCICLFRFLFGHSVVFVIVFFFFYFEESWFGRRTKYSKYSVTGSVKCQRTKSSIQFQLWISFFFQHFS